MIRIYDNKLIAIHHGDSGTIEANIKDDNGNAYEMQQGDILRFTVREKASHEEPVLILAETMDNFISLSHEATDIPVGKYSCDIQLTKSNGEVITVFPELAKKGQVYNFKNFIVDSEVSD